MNKILSIKKYVVALVVPLFTVGHVWAFDFSAVSSSGHRLYYTITSNTTPYTVEVVPPNSYGEWNGTGVVKPVGDVIVPSSVVIGGQTYTVTKLGNYAFVGCSGITSVNMPLTVTEIGCYAFKNCSSLSDINLHDSLLSIDICAFENCYVLDTIVVGNSVTTISSDAFTNCRNLRSVVLGSSLETLGGSVFYGCYSLTSVSFNNNLKYIGGSAFYNTGLSSLALPSSILSIGPYAFSNTPCYNDTNNWVDNVLYISNCLIEADATLSGTYTVLPGTSCIADKAFEECENLVSISLPTSMRGIGNYTFSGCYGLMSINMPDSIQIIGEYAFNNCYSLSYIEIPQALETLGYYAFNSCYNLDTVRWNSINTPLATNVFYQCNNFKTLIIGDSVRNIYAGMFSNINSLQNVFIGNSVDSIGNSAFSGCNRLASVYIPNSVTYIGASAFNNCDSIRYVEIPYSVTVVGGSAFGNCDSLHTVVWNAANVRTESFDGYSHPFKECLNLKNVVFGDSVRVIPNRALYNKTNIQSVVIGNNVDSIGAYAFYGCTNMVIDTLRFPNTLEYIGASAFNNCDSIRYVEIPYSVTVVGGSAFGNCDSLHTVVWNAANVRTESFDGYSHPFKECLNLKNVVFGDSVRTIPANVLSGHTQLQHVTIGNNVDSIGASAFRYCTNMVIDSLRFPNSLKYIGGFAFQDCDSIRYVYIPHTVDTLKWETFKDCDSIHTVVWNTNSNNAKLYDSYNSWDDPLTFPHVRTFVFGDSVRSVPYRALYDSDSLHTVILGNNVDTIGDEAFRNCYNLRNIDFANATNLRAIGYQAFYDCYNLRSIDFVNATNLTTIGNNAFYSCDSLRNINFGNATNLTTIGDNVFSNCLNLRDVDLENATNLVSIGSSAFQGCTALDIDSLRFSNTLKFIGGGAFNNIDSLRYVEIPYSVDTMGNYVFGGCDSIHTVVWNSPNSNMKNQFERNIKTLILGDSIKYIPNEAFRYSKIKTLVLSSNLDSIGYQAFYECDSLRNITFGNSLNNLVKIDKQAFYECFNLIIDTLRFGNRLKYIGEYAFGYTDVKYVEIPYSLDTIGSTAFSGCDSLTTVIWNSSEARPYNAFNGCDNIETFVFGDSITTIPQNTMVGSSSSYNRTNIRKMVFGSGLTSIASDAFRYIYNVDTIMCKASVPPTLGNANSLPGYSTTIDVLIVPCESTPAYLANTSWSSHFTDIVGDVHISGNADKLAVNNATYGNVDYDCSTGQMTAVPNYGYHFVQWNDGNTQNPRTASLAGNVMYTAIFAKNVYTISLTNTTQGVLTGAGQYEYLDTITISATANYGYTFLRWNDGDTNATRQVVVRENRVYAATFTPKLYTINVVSNDTALGSVSGGGLFAYNTTQTITGTPTAFEYCLLRWSDGNTDNPRTITVTCDTTYYAIFGEKPTYTITVLSSDSERGSVSGSGSHLHGTNVTIRANANTGYHFARWNDGNTQNPRNIQLLKDSTFTAIFEPNTYTITTGVYNNYNDRGSVTGGGVFEYKATITLSATANYGYHFEKWTDGVTSPTRTEVVTADKKYIAVFNPNTYALTLSSANTAMGTVAGAGSYEYGNEVVIRANSNTGYFFDCWSDGNRDNPRTIKITADLSLTASFTDTYIGIKDADEELETLALYPNPTTGMITLNRTDVQKIEVLDMMGRVVAVCENSNVVNITALTKGYYTLRITTDKGVAVRKVLKE